MSVSKEEVIASGEDRSRGGTIGYSDIYKGLWKCRDFELSHCWQRSVFLTAFLLACYAGYGALIMQCVTAEKMHLPFVIINIIAFCFCVVGVLLSLLWIMMAKGSKAWYEKYESAINTFVERYKEKKEAFEDDLWKVAGFGIMWCEEFHGQNISDWLWNSVGGRYSVSRINIALGHLSTVIWLGLALAHIYIASAHITSAAEFENRCCLHSNPTAMCFAGVVVLLLFWVYVRLAIKSSHLD